MLQIAFDFPYSSDSPYLDYIINRYLYIIIFSVGVATLTNVYELDVHVSSPQDIVESDFLKNFNIFNHYRVIYPQTEYSIIVGYKRH